MELNATDVAGIKARMTVTKTVRLQSKWTNDIYVTTIGTAPGGQAIAVEEYETKEAHWHDNMAVGYYRTYPDVATAIKEVESDSDHTILSTSLYNNVAAAWLPQTKPMAMIKIVDTWIEIHANDDRQQYEARIDGAVCAVQDYDGIRMDQQDPEFPAFLADVFQDGAQRARGAYVRGLGPIYV